RFYLRQKAGPSTSLGMTTFGLPYVAAHLAGLVAVQIYDLRAGWLFQGKLVVRQRLIHLQLHHGQRDVVLFLRPPYFDLRRKLQTVVVLVAFVPRICSQVSVLIVNQLAVRQQVGPAEDNLARE